MRAYILNYLFVPPVSLGISSSDNVPDDRDIHGPRTIGIFNLFKRLIIREDFTVLSGAKASDHVWETCHDDMQSKFSV
jgi:hypothetical protein